MIAKDHQKIPPRTAPKKCVWIYGKPGTGKTRAATLTYPDAYRKLQNKWWDGYQNQKEVIMDDLGQEVGKMLASHMKLWADPWNNQLGEVKSSYACLTYDTFIVTSNYHPSEIWDGVDLEAIMRRFEIKEMVPEYLEFHPGKVFEF